MRRSRRRGRAHGRAPLGSVPGAEQDEGREGPPFPAVGLLEFAENGAGVEDETLDFALVEDRERVVVRPVPLVLQVDKQAGEVANLDGERTRLLAPASLLRAPVIDGAVDADPARLPAHVPVEQLVGAALGETVKQGVVGCAHGAPKVRLERSARAGGKEVLGGGEEVRRSQA